MARTDYTTLDNMAIRLNLTPGASVDPWTYLEAANDQLALHGVEDLRFQCEPETIVNARYVNTGESYDATILHDTQTLQYLAISWADFLEAHELDCEDCQGLNSLYNPEEN